MNQTKVTVVIPVYNTKKYLKECVDSITNQTFKNIEILLIDDGSPDGSPVLCDELANTDNRITVIHKENGGAASVRNLGIEKAKGEYIMFLDSDDWIDEDAIETLIKNADKNKTDVIRFNYVREFKDKKLIKKNTFLKEKVYVGEECHTIRRQVLGLIDKELANPENMNFLASCGFNMYRTELLRKSGVKFIDIKEYGAFVDGLFNFCVFKDVKHFQFIDEPFYHYRKTNEVAATKNYRKNYIPRQQKLFNTIKTEILETDSWEFFSSAFNSRIVYSSMEMAFNALRNNAPFCVKYKEIKSILKKNEFKSAYKAFDLKYLGAKWKVYYFFIKRSWVLPTYLMTWVVLKLKNRGVS